MGFSLKMFFEELEWIIKNPESSLEETYEILVETIREAKQYAEDCGQL